MSQQMLNGAPVLHDYTMNGFTTAGNTKYLSFTGTTINVEHRVFSLFQAEHDKQNIVHEFKI